MTKPRPPLTQFAALARIARQLPGGWPEMARHVGRAESLVRKWGDPDQREEIPLADAIALDQAHRHAGGIGAPLFDFFALSLDLATLRSSDNLALGDHLGVIIRESAEAELAILDAARPGAGAKEAQIAMREIEEALTALRHALTLLATATGRTGGQ